jgi:hypothetical protein
MHIRCSIVFIGMEVIMVRRFVENVSKGTVFYIAVQYGTVLIVFRVTHLHNFPCTC